MLVVPDCPSVRPLREHLECALKGREDVTVAWREVTEADEAERLGMHGSPTLLVDGVDPHTHPGQAPSLSCKVGALPSVDQIREVLAQAAPS